MIRFGDVSLNLIFLSGSFPEPGLESIFLEVIRRVLETEEEVWGKDFRNWAPLGNVSVKW